MDEHKDLVTLQRFDNQTEAEICKGLLEDAGIPAMVLGEYAQGIFPYTSAVPIKIKVAPEDEKRAREVLLARFDTAEFEAKTAVEVDPQE